MASVAEQQLVGEHQPPGVGQVCQEVEGQVADQPMGRDVRLVGWIPRQHVSGMHGRLHEAWYRLHHLFASVAERVRHASWHRAVEFLDHKDGQS